MSQDQDGLALSVWLRLLKAHGLVLRELRRRLPPRLTLPQFDVLAQLHRHETEGSNGAGLTPGELSGELLVTAGNLTGIVERLVRMGLVSRQRDRADRRALRLRLTARGRRLMRGAIPRHRREVAAMLSALPAADLRRLRGLLGELTRGLECEGGASPHSRAPD